MRNRPIILSEIIVLLLIALVIGITVGCNKQSSPSLKTPFADVTSMAPVSPISPINPTTGSPIPPVPTEPDADALEAVAAVTEPQTGQGVVVGMLFDTVSQQPLANMPVFLSSVKGVDEGFPVASLDRSRDPGATTDEKGIFIFDAVPPGHYVIIVGFEGDSFLLNDPETGLSVNFQIDSGQMVNLGVLGEHLP